MSNNPFRADDEEEPPTLFGVEEPPSGRSNPGFNAPEAGFGAAGGGGFGDLGAIEDDLAAGGGLGGFDDMERGLGFGPVGGDEPPATLGPPTDSDEMAGGLGGFDDMERGLGFGPIDGGESLATLGPPADGADMAGGLGGFDDMERGLGFGGLDAGGGGGSSPLAPNVSSGSGGEDGEPFAAIGGLISSGDSEEAREVEAEADRIAEEEGREAAEEFLKERRGNDDSLGSRAAGAASAAASRVRGALSRSDDSSGRRDRRASSRPQVGDESEESAGRDRRASSRPQTGESTSRVRRAAASARQRLRGAVFGSAGDDDTGGDR